MYEYQRTNAGMGAMHAWKAPLGAARQSCGCSGLGTGEEGGGTPWYIIPAVIVVGGLFLFFEGMHLYGEATGRGQGFPRRS